MDKAETRTPSLPHDECTEPGHGGAGSGIESQTSYSYPNPKTVFVAQDQNTTGDQALKSQTQYEGLGPADRE